jgi:hypothetical protein
VRLHRKHRESEESWVTPIARRTLTGDAAVALAKEMAAPRGIEKDEPCPTEH